MGFGVLRVLEGFNKSSETVESLGSRPKRSNPPQIVAVSRFASRIRGLRKQDSYEPEAMRLVIESPDSTISIYVAKSLFLLVIQFSG